MTTNNIDMLKKLHDIGLLDDKAFIDGIKRATGGSIMTRPLRDEIKPVPLPQYPFTTGTPLTEPSSSAIKGKFISNGSPLTATYTPDQCYIDCSTLKHSEFGDRTFSDEVDVVPYTENRSHLPQHAQDVLAWIDEAWDKTFREYNDTKEDWERYEFTDEDGIIKAGWIHKPSRKIETDVKDMMEMFNLEFDSGNQP